MTSSMMPLYTCDCSSQNTREVETSVGKHLLKRTKPGCSVAIGSARTLTTTLLLMTAPVRSSCFERYRKLVKRSKLASKIRVEPRTRARDSRFGKVKDVERMSTRTKLCRLCGRNQPNDQTSTFLPLSPAERPGSSVGRKRKDANELYDRKLDEPGEGGAGRVSKKVGNDGR